MICKLSVGIWWQIMEKLPVHFPLPLRGIPNQKSSTGANLSLFGIFCHINGMVGNNVIELLEILSIFLVEIITVHTTMPFLWQIKFLWHYYPTCHFCGTENISRIEKCMCSPHTSRSNCHFCGMVGNNVINQFCASFVAWRVTTFKKGAGWIGLN